MTTRPAQLALFAVRSQGHPLADRVHLASEFAPATALSTEQDPRPAPDAPWSTAVHRWDTARPVSETRYYTIRRCIVCGCLWRRHNDGSLSSYRFQGCDQWFQARPACLKPTTPEARRA